MSSTCATSAGSPASISASTWKLPSPTWPTMGAISPISAMSASVSAMHSASREIGTQTSVERPRAPGRKRQRRPVGVVARLPELRAFLRHAGPQERPAAVFGGDLAEAFRLLGDACVAAVELHEQAWPLRIVQLRIVYHGAHLQRVDELDARHRNAHLDRRDHRPAGGLDARERAHAARNCLRDAIQLQRQRGDDAERAFRADQEPRQVVAGRTLPGPRARRQRGSRRPSPRSATARCRASCRSAPRWCPKPWSPPCRRAWRWRRGRSGRTGRCRADIR